MTAVAAAVSAALLASCALDLYLRRRQIACVAAHRDEVPEPFRAAVSLADHQRAADYVIAHTRLGAAATLADTALTLLAILALLGPLYTLASALSPPGLTRSVFVVIAAGAAGALAALPAALARTFWIEAKFGFNRTTPGLFARDHIKTLALQLLVAAPLLYGLFWLVRTWPQGWPFAGWAACVALSIGLGALYPMWIAPLFNAFTPLPEGGMKRRIEALLARCGFESKGLYVMDASRRSGRGNAYFSGFGKAKRIVFFDTLLAKHSEEEIISVLAHELGHFRLGHIAQRIVQSTLVMAAAFAALSFALAPDGLAVRFGLPGDPGLGLILALVALGPILRLAAPLMNFFSRRAEFEADAFAKAMVGKDDMIGALVRLSRDNLATLTPDQLYAMFYYTHPPIPIRVARLAAG